MCWCLTFVNYVSIYYPWFRYLNFATTVHHIHHSQPLNSIAFQGKKKAILEANSKVYIRGSCLSKFLVQVLLWVGKEACEAVFSFPAYFLIVAAVPCHPWNPNLSKEPSTEWCWSLRFLTPLCSYFLFLSTSYTRSCSLLPGALCCFITSTGHSMLLPFILQPLSTKSGPRLNWDGESHQEQITPSASPSQISLIASPVQILIPSSPSTSFLDTLRAANFPVCRYLGMDYLHIWKNNFSWDSVCVVWQKKPTTYPHVRRKPSHTIREQNCWTNFLLFQPFWRSQFLLWLGVKWLKHGQKERSRFSCNAWTHFFIL